MTTTYELYTNENGTPKAVEGKAPAIIERVEALETDVKTLDGDVGSIQTTIEALETDVGNVETAIEVLEGGVVKTINGETPDQAGNIDIPVGHNVGEEWISYTGKIPNGGVPYCGQIVTRATYADLWAYAQAQGLVKTEAEWQSWASSHGGNVPYYSSGNGSTTFRMPSIKGYVKGASSQSEAGTHLFEGLPNITGVVSLAHVTGSTVSGALSVKNESGNANFGTTSSAKRLAVSFDASRSNPIYGNSDHVTPETSVVMFGVYAFGEITNQGALDAETLATGLAKVEANLEAKLDKTSAHIVETWVSNDGLSWYRKWSDGWIEQGGYIEGLTSGKTYTITLNTAMTTTKYTILSTGARNQETFSYYGQVVGSSQTKTNFKFYTYQTDRLYWCVSGY